MTKNEIIYGSIAIVGLFLFFKHQAAAAAVAVADAVNPLDPENIFYSATTGVVEQVAGPNETLGTLAAGHCFRKAQENGGEYPWYCPTP